MNYEWISVDEVQTSAFFDVLCVLGGNCTFQLQHNYYLILGVTYKIYNISYQLIGIQHNAKVVKLHFELTGETGKTGKNKQYIQRYIKDSVRNIPIEIR